MTRNITIYTRPSCGPCMASKRSMDKIYGQGSYAEQPGSDNLDLLEKLGYRAAPVTVIRDPAGEIVDHWHGFRPDKIEEWAA